MTKTHTHSLNPLSSTNEPIHPLSSPSAKPSPHISDQK
jgi:hypothetical protein